MIRTCRRAFLFWTFVAVLGASSRARALDPSQPLDRYVHQAWTTEQGLPQNSVYAVAATRDGYLWMGTDEGLARFDGMRFTVFDRASTPALRDPFVISLHEAPDGSLWAGTDRGGLTRIQSGRYSHFGPDEGLPAARVQAIADGAGGTLWIGLRGGGLARYAAGRFRIYTVLDGLLSDNVLAVFEDRGGRVWIGTEAGLDRFEGGKFVHFTARDGLPPGSVRAIREDREGRLWIGTIAGLPGTRVAGGGLAIFRDGRFEIPAAIASNALPGVMGILEDRDGNLWLGTSGGGIARLRDGRVESWIPGTGPAAGVVWSLAEDSEGSLWFGTQPGGIHRLGNSLFSSYTKRDGLPDEVIESVFENRAGRFVIGTHAGGVCTVESEGLKCLSTANGLAHNRVNAILEDSNGDLWLGTEGGLDRLQGGDAGKITRYTTRDGLPADHVNALLRDRAGTLWVGTWGGGLARWSGGRFEPYGPNNGVGLYVNVLYQGRGDRVWIGTTEGLSVWDGGELIDETKTRGMPAAVEAVYEDGSGYLWIGTRRDGLFLSRNGRLSRITTREGLFDNLAGTILEDGGNLWITCNKGIYRVSRRELLEVVDGARAAVLPRSFGTGDGMPNRECDFGQGSLKTRDGRLWFATVGGAVAIDPARVAANTVPPPPVHIEEVTVDGEALAANKPGRIASGNRRLEFRFVGLSLAAPARVRYRYRLEGFDRGWTDGRDARSAHYTNVPPGAYRFLVTAANGDGVWDSQGASYEFEIASPLWRRPWFAAAALLTAAALVFAVFQRRVARLRRERALESEFSRQLISSQEHERQRLARELHDGIGQNLLVIGNWTRLASDALGSPERARPPLDVIAETTAQSLKEIRAMTRALQPYEIEQIGCGEAIRAMLPRIGEASGLAITADIQDFDGALPPEAGLNLYRIVQETVSNIVKHAGATEARVTLRRGPRGLELSVSDNGRGLPTTPNGHGGEGGFGLRSLAARAKLLGGTHRIVSSPGRGTTVIVEAPLPESPPQ